MAVRLMGEVWGHSRARGTALLLLLAIADSGDDDTRECYARARTLQRKARTSPRWFDYLVTKLEELGELRVYSRPDSRDSLYVVQSFNPDEWEVHFRENNYPEGGGNIKDPERQQVIKDRRSTQPRRPKYRKHGKS